TAADATLSGTRTFTWTVDGVDRTPVLATLGNVTTVVGAAVVRTTTATDPDGDALTYVALGLPPGVNIDPSTGVLSGTPTTAGTYNATVTVQDTGALTTSRSFVWTV